MSWEMDSVYRNKAVFVSKAMVSVLVFASQLNKCRIIMS